MRLSVMEAEACKCPPVLIFVLLLKSYRNVAEQLIEKGLATALRHKRDDEDRSPDYDKLMAAEQT